MHVIRWIFLRFLGLIYLSAFLSLWPQIPGLIGSRGILPAHDLLNAAGNQLGVMRYWFFPTLFWLNHSDIFLQIICIAGICASILLVIGIAPVVNLSVLWFFYLSFYTVGGDFLQFQWDVLLLETGFLAVFFAPLQWTEKLSSPSQPSPMIVWLFRWLLFRLMLLSGASKLLSGDPTWRDLTALNFHYQTQPLPTWIGWYAHHLSGHFQSFSVFTMFVIELVIPFFIFLPRKLRLFAFFPIVGLQLLILLTGNYCFFNLLAIALSILLLDDAFIMRSSSAATERKEWPRWITISVASLVLFLSFIQTTIRFREPVPMMRPFYILGELSSPFCITNSYGLFAVMTTSRSEIIVEGSDDGDTWQVYEFKYKPGDLKKKPSFVEPHQPRLDWQMWFAALGNYRQNRWFMLFLKRLLEGSKPVLDLMAKNPFPDKPPKYVRAVLYDYRFTSPEEKKRTGEWWTRAYQHPYCPTVSLEDYR